MNRIIALVHVKQYFLCVLPILWRIWHISGRFDQHLSLLLFLKTEIQHRAGILVLVRVLWVTISKLNWQFWQSFFKYVFKSSSNFYPIEITWRKMASSVCLKPVSMDVTWRLHTLWHFTVPVNWFSKMHAHNSNSGHVLRCRRNVWRV